MITSHYLFLPPPVLCARDAHLLKTVFLPISSSPGCPYHVTTFRFQLRVNNVFIVTGLVKESRSWNPAIPRAVAVDGKLPLGYLACFFHSYHAGACMCTFKVCRLSFSTPKGGGKCVWVFPPPLFFTHSHVCARACICSCLPS